MQLLRDKIKRDTYMCSKICNMIARGDLRDNHPQQRKSGQWSRETRDNFIVTVIKNEDFDPIKICEQLTDEGIVLWLIDGLQRSTTIENFKAGKFALGRNINPYIVEYQEAEKNDNGQVTYKNVSYDLRGKSYVDLPEKLKEDFDNCPVYVVKHLDCSNEEVGRHIIRYNSGRPMVAAQKITTYMCNTAKFVKKLSSHAFFNDCANYSETADKNGTVDKVISESIMGLNFFNVWNKNAQKIGKYLNNNATEEMFDKFGSYLDRLLEVITPETGKLFSQKNALIWFMLFDRFSKKKLSDDKFQVFLENYDKFKKIKVKVFHEYELVKGSGEYTDTLSFSEIDGCKSTKDKGVIEDKLYILETVMDEFLHIEDTDNEISLKHIEIDTEVVNEVSFIADIVGINKEDVNTDFECYKDTLKDLKNNTIRDGSRLLNEENNLSLLAMVAYSYKEDKDLDEWMIDYASKNNTYFVDQRKNFYYMKQSYEQWEKGR